MVARAPITSIISGHLIVELRPTGVPIAAPVTAKIGITLREDGTSVLRLFKPWALGEPAFAEIPLLNVGHRLWDAMTALRDEEPRAVASPKGGR